MHITSTTSPYNKRMLCRIDHSAYDRGSQIFKPSESQWRYEMNQYEIGSVESRPDFYGFSGEGINVTDEPVIINIDKLLEKRLRRSISVVLERDDDGYIAKISQLPLYGFGDTKKEALDHLKFEIESLYAELNEDDNFTDEWLKYRDWLSGLIMD